MRRKSISILGASIFLLALSLPSGSAAQENEPDTAIESNERSLGGFFAESLQNMLRSGRIFMPNGASAQPVPSATPGEPERFKLNFNNAPVDQVLKFVSDMTKKMLIKDDEVNGQFNLMNPNEITQEEALQFIEAAFMLKGFTFLIYDQMIICLPIAKAKQAGVDVELGPVSDRLSAQVKTHIIQLKYVTPSQLKTSLASLFSTNAVIVADDRTKSFIITDTVSNIKRIETIILQLDKQDSLEGLVVRVFKLRYGDAREISRGLADLVENIVFAKMTGSDVRTRRDQSSYSVEVLADRVTNSLIIAAPKEAIEDVADFIQKIDVPITQNIEMKTFPLKNGDATEIAQNLSELARSLQTSVYRPSVVANARTNTIIVYAYPEDVKTVGELIATLDSGKSYDKVTKVFPLQNADAIIISSMLQQLIGEGDSRNQYRSWYGYGRGRDQQQEIKIIEDQRMNAIIVTARPADMPLVEDLIHQLDKPLPVSKEEPHVYPVKHVRATDIAFIVNELFSENQNRRGGGFFFNPFQQDQGMTGLTGKVKALADQTTNSLIVIAGTPRAFDVVEKLVQQLDRVAPDEFGTTQVFHLKNADAEYLAEQLNQLFQEDAARSGNRGFYWFMNQSSNQDQAISNLIGQVRIVSETRTNSIMVTTSAQYFEPIRNLIEDLDREISQVLIEILIVEIIDLQNNQVGINWPDNIPITVQTNFDAPLSAMNLERAAIISSANFNTVIDFLASDSKTNVVARPNILTRDNQGAFVEVVTRVPVVTAVNLTNAGAQQQADYEEVGLKLNVTPHINDATTVTIDVNLENGQVLDTLGLETQGIVIPAFSRRTIQTKLTIENNETAVLSGVLDTSQVESESGIPGLMHIPLIGSVFKTRTKKRSNTELIAFITPYILSNAQDRDQILQRHRERIEMYSKFKEQMDDLNIRVGTDK
ncbi:MAG: hypothetical protein C4527_26335 [Candidatus Omnitrophota bacterium]|jgi:type II secretory pathway component GspD/PulD (secretin)|nr:MAG: hypothetical protein C4527_26335 [Candidatus Omnitrophota bacterium]